MFYLIRVLLSGLSSGNFSVMSLKRVLKCGVMIFLKLEASCQFHLSYSLHVSRDKSDVNSCQQYRLAVGTSKASSVYLITLCLCCGMYVYRELR